MAENLGNTEEQIEVITEGMTEDVTDKKCPNCGATVVYDPETLSMSCPFCGYSRQLPKPEGYVEEEPRRREGRPNRERRGGFSGRNDKPRRNFNEEAEEAAPENPKGRRREF